VSIAEKITGFFEKGASHFLPYLVEEKKKYRWNKMADAIQELANL
jgi:hypothetical protein